MLKLARLFPEVFLMYWGWIAKWVVPSHKCRRARIVLPALLVVLKARSSSSFALRSTSRISHLSMSNLPEIPVDPSITRKRLFLVRHGEVINPGGDHPVYYGSMDVSLSELGKQEAQAAGDFLTRYPLAFVACSPLSRAVYGAEQIQRLQGSGCEKDLVVLDGFKELDRGSWCGMTKGEIGLENLARFDACDERVTPEGGESYPQLKSRVLAARDKVLARMEPGQSAAIVSHLQVTRSILSEALEIPTNEMAKLSISTASVTCVEYDIDGSQHVAFQSFKPQVGLLQSIDEAN